MNVFLFKPFRELAPFIEARMAEDAVVSFSGPDGNNPENYPENPSMARNHYVTDFCDPDQLEERVEDFCRFNGNLELALICVRAVSTGTRGHFDNHNFLPAFKETLEENALIANVILPYLLNNPNARLGILHEQVRAEESESHFHFHLAFDLLRRMIDEYVRKFSLESQIFFKPFNRRFPDFFLPRAPCPNRPY